MIIHRGHIAGQLARHGIGHWNLLCRRKAPREFPRSERKCSKSAPRAVAVPSFSLVHFRGYDVRGSVIQSRTWSACRPW